MEKYGKKVSQSIHHLSAELNISKPTTIFMAFSKDSLRTPFT